MNPPVDFTALKNQEIARERDMWVRKLGEVVYLFASLEDVSVFVIRLLSGGRVSKSASELSLKRRNARALDLLRTKLTLSEHQALIDRWASLLAAIDRASQTRNDIVHNPFVVAITFPRGVVHVSSGLALMRDEGRLLVLADIARFVEELVPLRDEAVRLQGPTLHAAEEVGLNVSQLSE